MSAEVEGALVAAVRARPNDWRSWLVYADWLTEQGDSRGELVALEHRLAVEALSSEERHALRARADALTEMHRESCLAALALPKGSELELHHGFVVGVRLPWSDEALAVLDALVAHPLACSPSSTSSTTTSAPTVCARWPPRSPCVAVR
jgi:uncharacterized protein (TIGR02996 family)